MSQEQPIKKAFLPSEEVAEMVGLSKKQMMYRMEWGKFPDYDVTVSMETRRYWHRAVIERWLEKAAKSDR